MCFLCFFEKRSQFFWTALHQISYVDIAADLVHESTASFSNQTWIRATVELGDVQVTLVENRPSSMNGPENNAKDFSSVGARIISIIRGSIPERGNQVMEKARLPSDVVCGKRQG